jgi:potassium-transporting ATPase KdpC subunit
MSNSEEVGEHPPRVFPEAPRAMLREQVRPAILGALVLSILTGCAFPLLLYVGGRILFPRQADGSLVKKGDVVVGAELIGQQFARPEYFQTRPSAAGNGYDATSSGGTNLGPNNPKLKNGSADFAGIGKLAEEYRRSNGLGADTDIPIDAVTRSGSGLDPDITPDNAEFQVARVAHARGMKEASIRRLVQSYTLGPQFGFLGNSRVNVLELNLALDGMSREPPQTGTR